MLGILNQTIWILIRFFGICWKYNEWVRPKIFGNSSNNVNQNSAPFFHPITGKYSVVSLSTQLIIYPSPSKRTSSHIDSKCSVRVLWNWKLNKWHIGYCFKPRGIALFNTTANGVLCNVPHWLYQGVLYFQNAVWSHDRRVNVMTLTSIWKVRPFFTKIHEGSTALCADLLY